MHRDQPQRLAAAVTRNSDDANSQHRAYARRVSIRRRLRRWFRCHFDRYLFPYIRQSQAKVHQKLCGDPVVLGKNGQQQVLAANEVAAEVSRFLLGPLHKLLPARREWQPLRVHQVLPAQKQFCMHGAGTAEIYFKGPDALAPALDPSLIIPRRTCSVPMYSCCSQGLLVGQRHDLASAIGEVLIHRSENVTISRLGMENFEGQPVKYIVSVDTEGLACVVGAPAERSMTPRPITSSPASRVLARPMPRPAPCSTRHDRSRRRRRPRLGRQLSLRPDRPALRYRTRQRVGEAARRRHRRIGGAPARRVSRDGQHHRRRHRPQLQLDDVSVDEDQWRGSRRDRDGYPLRRLARRADDFSRLR